jgi:ornithine cyclodeaminase/alanine dehydrogenase-like protein (mu-crystallin family)
MTLLLDEQEVTQLVSMDLALEATEEALRGLGDGTASNQPRRRVRTP